MTSYADIKKTSIEDVGVSGGDTWIYDGFDIISDNWNLTSTSEANDLTIDNGKLKTSLINSSGVWQNSNVASIKKIKPGNFTLEVDIDVDPLSSGSQYVGFSISGTAGNNVSFYGNIASVYSKIRVATVEYVESTAGILTCRLRAARMGDVIEVSYRTTSNSSWVVLNSQRNFPVEDELTFSLVTGAEPSGSIIATLDNLTIEPGIV